MNNIYVTNLLVNSLTTSEKWGLGLKVAGIGILVVFAILVVLILLIKLMGKIMERNKAKVQEKTIQATKNEQVTKTVASSDDEISAVITAAIYSILSSESQGSVAPDFKIRKIRKIRR